MALTVGTDVLVLPLNRKGRIVEVGGKGRYRVALGAITSWHDEADLSPVAVAGGKARRAARPAAEHETVQWERQPGAAGLTTLDLHGFTVEEALRAVEARLDEAIRAGLDEIEIIHGIGGGRLRAALHRYLGGVPSVARFSLDPHNRGVTRVWF
ncbi:MAG TPA: Smr/MutS family protein [Vicinamibacterales bacterium]|nr:Smr/MutS family protein [Vicinamibacterales bacterium]